MPSSKGELFGFCSACNVHIFVSSGKMEVKKHSAGKKHRENCNAAAKQPSVLDMPGVSG